MFGHIRATKGELSTILAVVSLLVIAVGAGLGARSSELKISQDLFPRANQESACDYDSTSQIRINGSVATDVPGFSWKSEGDGTAVFEDSQTYPVGKLENSWHARPLPESMFRNKYAKTTVTIPSDYTIVSTFCEDDTNDICKNIKVSNLQKTIGNIHMPCGGKVTYGWNVALTSSLAPSPTPKDYERFQTFVGQCEASFEQVADPNIERITIGPVGGTPLFSIDASNQDAMKKTGKPCSSPIGLGTGSSDLCIPFYMAFKSHRFQINFDPRRQKDVALSVSNPSTRKATYDRQGLIPGSGADPMEVTIYYFFKKGTGRDIHEVHHSTSVITKGGCEVKPTATPTPTSTPTPTPTTIPTAAPTLTPQPTTIPTPTQEIARCNEAISFSGKKGTHSFPIYLGPRTGVVQFFHNARSIPDRFRLNYDSSEVINTGFRSTRYDDPVQRAAWNNDLALIGMPPLTGKDPETATFNKTSTADMATVYVDAPFDLTAWDVRISCPGETLPTPTSYVIPIKQTFNADIDQNGVVNTFDYLAIIRDFGKDLKRLDSYADVNNDGVVNVKDVSAVLGELGKTR